MKVYIATKKNTGNYSWEKYVIVASGKRELEEIFENEVCEDIKLFDIEETKKSGLIYTDIY